MRKNVFGRHLKRDSNERTALFKGLASSLVLHERIQTTEEKAKAVRPLVEKLVTRARIGDVQAHSLIQPYLNAEALKKMMHDIAPRFKNRPGGYTRIIKMGPRLQDNASVVILEWVEKPVVAVATTAKSEGRRAKGSNETKVEVIEAEIKTDVKKGKEKVAKVEAVVEKEVKKVVKKATTKKTASKAVNKSGKKDK